MSTQNLDALFQPQSIAVVGGSDRRDSVGYTLVHNLRTTGFPGAIYPVNPKYDQVQGLPAFPTIAALPVVPDLAVLAIPAASVPAAVDELAARGTRAVVVVSAGFRESGAAGATLEEQLTEVRRQHQGLRILGPNCMGFIVPRAKVNASFGGENLKPGRIAFASQSGALCSAVLDWAQSENVGFSLFVSLGNMLDVDFADCIDYLADDPDTDGLVLYVESISRAREFLSAARAFTRRKPIVVYKAGRCQAGAKAAASHTGAMAGLDSAYDAAFRRAAIVRVNDSRELVDCAELLARSRLPAGPEMAILTNAGGPGVMAADALAETTSRLAELSQTTIAKLDGLLPAYWSHRNPVDVLGDATPERFAQAARILIEDEKIDGLLMILTPQAMTWPTETAERSVQSLAGAMKPILATWMGGEGVQAGRKHLQQHAIPTFDAPEDAVRAFSRLAEYAAGLKWLYETPTAAPLRLGGSMASRRAERAGLLPSQPGLLDEVASKALIAVYGIPTSRPRIARDAEEAVRRADEIDLPVVMKIHSRDINHKSDAGGVRVNLQTVEEVRAAFEGIMADVGRLCPQARLEGVTIQAHVAPLYGLEMILGSRRDPSFGPVMMIGLGGTTAEIMHDCTFELPPLDARLARGMLERLRIWPILNGYRGRPRLAIERVIEVMLQFSTLLAECPEIAEVDVNPLLVSPTEVVALDARILTTATTGERASSYGHLAIAPYPDEWVRTVRLRDGSEFTLRPIRPEDEPRWHEMLDVASDRSIMARFRSLFRSVVHRQAARYCFIDYDREMAFVAETTSGDASRLVGVGRLVTDSARLRAEFGTLVIDEFQKRGIGRQLLDLCLEYARESHYQSVYAETSWDNRPMLKLFRERGFHIEPFPHDPTTLHATLELAPSHT